MGGSAPLKFLDMLLLWADPIDADRPGLPNPSRYYDRINPTKRMSEVSDSQVGGELNISHGSVLVVQTE